MTELYNKTSEKDKRQHLRNNMPPAEQLVWARLKGRQVEDCKLRRQYSVGAFVIDFYSVEIKLAIEIDGESHFRDGAEVYDSERQSSIEAAGIRFLRFTNQQVYEELDAVIESIAQMICALRELPHPSPPLYKGREPEKPSLTAKARGLKKPPFRRGVGG
ncbi:endonuclease domain-containing protein [Chamaesiphon sp. GL140_3_metabinner_50]|uniref:endonuclease domain-containing protein n=1 Tax=Chamaesiphon sp. GL140_3_metabinner_50 TaxID=2970812 RepID=UPI0025E8E70B|nr:endonuclease domain-containing protein [Chamaesiphon sp. GL140_3_metabinner_50]